MVDNDNVHTIASEIFNDAMKWLENNSNYFDHTIKRDTPSDDLQFKASTLC